MLIADVSEVNSQVRGKTKLSTSKCGQPIDGCAQPIHGCAQPIDGCAQPIDGCAHVHKCAYLACTHMKVVEHFKILLKSGRAI
jgi:hypothetical protein